MNKETYLSLRSPIESVPLPNGVTGYVRVMTGTERLSWVLLVDAEKEGGGQRSTSGLLSRCICDKDGARVFTDSEDDLTALGGMDVTVIDPLRKSAMRINGLSVEGQDDAKKN